MRLSQSRRQQLLQEGQTKDRRRDGSKSSGVAVSSTWRACLKKGAIKGATKGAQSMPIEGEATDASVQDKEDKVELHVALVLTGLLNRRAFAETLGGSRRAHASRPNTPGAIAATGIVSS